MRRLSGEWKTAEGQSPRLSMTIQPFGSSVMLGFQRVDGGKTQVSGGNNYDFEGGGGQGRFSVDFPPTSEWDVRMKPTRVDYRLRADALEATITSSVFAGSYTLRR